MKKAITKHEQLADDLNIQGMNLWDQLYDLFEHQVTFNIKTELHALYSNSSIERCLLRELNEQSPN